MALVGCLFLMDSITEAFCVILPPDVNIQTYLLTYLFAFPFLSLFAF